MQSARVGRRRLAAGRQLSSRIIYHIEVLVVGGASVGRLPPARSILSRQNYCQARSQVTATWNQRCSLHCHVSPAKYLMVTQRQQAEAHLLC